MRENVDEVTRGQVKPTSPLAIRLNFCYYTAMNTTEIIGLAASVLVLVSFLMKGSRVIRTINIAACIVFVVYGVLIEALSIWLLNGLLILVHIYYLARSRKPRVPVVLPAMQVVVQDEERRLQKFSREGFSKNGLRELSWFVTVDLE